jgi:hypothetical protein
MRRELNTDGAAEKCVGIRRRGGVLTRVKELTVLGSNMNAPLVNILEDTSGCKAWNGSVHAESVRRMREFISEFVAKRMA